MDVLKPQVDAMRLTLFLSLTAWCVSFVWQGCRPYLPPMPKVLPKVKLQLHPTRMGMPRWVFPPEGQGADGYISSAPVLGEQSVLYFSNRSRLHAVDFQGRRSWTWQPPRKQEQSVAPPALSPDKQTIFVGTQQRYLYALNKGGALLWGKAALSGSMRKPMWVTSRRIYASTGQQLEVFAHNGEAVWKYVGGASKEFSTVAQHSDGSLSLTEPSGVLHLLQPNRAGKSCPGYRKLRSDAPGSFVCTQKKYCKHITTDPVVGVSGLTYFGCKNGDIVAVRPDHKEAWRAETEGEVLGTPVLGPGGRALYVNSGDGYLYVLNVKDGKVRWRFRSGLYSRTPTNKFKSAPEPGTTMYSEAPVRLDEAGRVFVGTSNQIMHLLTAGGGLVWQYRLDGWINYAPILQRMRGTTRLTLYVVSGQRLFAFNF